MSSGKYTGTEPTFDIPLQAEYREFQYSALVQCQQCSTVLAAFKLDLAQYIKPQFSCPCGKGKAFCVP